MKIILLPCDRGKKEAMPLEIYLLIKRPPILRLKTKNPEKC
jgi:hypothetical protein